MLKNNHLVISVLACAMFCAGSAQAEKAIGSSAQPINLTIIADTSYPYPLTLDNASAVVAGHITGYTLSGDAPSFIQDYPSSLYKYLDANTGTNVNASINVTQFAAEAGQPLRGGFVYNDLQHNVSCGFIYSITSTVATATPVVSGTTLAGSYGFTAGVVGPLSTTGNCALVSARGGSNALLIVSMLPTPAA